MSVIVSVYTNSAFRDYLLPAVNNSNYDMILKRGVFALEDDVILKLEIIDGSWSLLESELYRVVNAREQKKRLSDGEIFNIETLAGESISCMVKETTQSFTAFWKYDLTNTSKLTIGSVEENDLQYQCATFVSKHHATIQRVERGFAIRDTSLNGTFVNYIKINGTRPLHVGDCINIFGLKIVYLGTAIAVNATDSNMLKVNLQLERISGQKANAEVKRQEEKKLFHRAPRYYTKLEKETVEIEAPPAPRAVARKPLWMTIGPSFTMVIPMLLGSIVAIISAKASGSEASIYMFTGIFTAASSAVVGAFWAVTNIRYAGKEAIRDEKIRQEAYQAYLVEKEKDIEEKFSKYSGLLHQMYPAASEVINYNQESAALWNRNRRHDDFLCPRVGLGEMEFPVEISIPKKRFTLVGDGLADKPGKIKEKYSYLHNVPVQVDLFANRLFGVVGGKNKAGCYGFVRTLIAQIAACNCYTDVKLVLVYDRVHDDGNWEYAYWLPHVWSEDKKTRYIASDKAETSEVFYELLQIFRARSESEQGRKNLLPKPFYVMIIASPELLEGEPVTKYIMNGEACCGVTTFLLADSEEALPNECENIIRSEKDEIAIYNVNGEHIQKVTLDQISEKELEAFARRILPVRVSETETGRDVPASMSFFEMYGVEKLSEFRAAENWKKNRTYETMRAMIGAKAGGAPCYLDIHEKYHGPHGLVAGTTGSGKSETLQTYILSLALNFSPDDIGFFIIDFKGGGMAGLFDRLPHLIGSVSNLSGNQVRRAMISIKSENKRRQRLFNENNVNNINLYTKLYKDGEVKVPLPHMFIIVDEFAELKREEPEFMKELISVAQVGRSLGVHLILSTQKPSGTVDDNIWSNSKFRLCLRVQDKQDSNDMLHKADAAYITQTGRGYLQVGNDEVYELFQSGYSGSLYSENGESVKSETASMVATNGKTSLSGNHQKRIRQERARKHWMEELILCIVEAVRRGRQTMEEFVHNENRTELVFERIRENHIDYARSDYNARRIETLINAVKVIMDEFPEAAIEEIADRVISASGFGGMKFPEEKRKTQLDAIIEYLANIAEKEGYSQQMQLWMPLLPSAVYLDGLTDGKKEGFDGSKWEGHGRWTLKTVVGITDDPENQAQLPLSVDLTESGNIAVFGSVTSGKSTFLQTLLYGLMVAYEPSWLNFYALDFSSHMLSCFVNAPHFGGVVYEEDSEKITKLFSMLDTMIAERKKMFHGGNYAQYIKANGVKLPMIVVVIDNLGAFREKTDGKYDAKLTQILREGIGYGIQFVVTASGFSSAEVNSKMADSFKTTFTIQLNDKYSYCEALRINQIEMLPENNIKGRGLARTGEGILEYQTALVFEAEDDYQRLEAIDSLSRRMALAWSGRRAGEIPVIPENPLWEEFEQLESYKRMISEKRYLPVGYDAGSAEVYGIDLAKNFIYLISAERRSEKINMQKAVINSASKINARIVVIEHSLPVLRAYAANAGAEHISSQTGQADFFRNHLELIKERNKRKAELESIGKDEAEIFEEMKSEQPFFFIISDLVDFVRSVIEVENDVMNIKKFLRDLFEKGSQIQIYFFIGVEQNTLKEIRGNSLGSAITAYRKGIWFGGRTELLSDYMDFRQFSAIRKEEVRKTRKGMLAAANNEGAKEVIIPLIRG